MSSSPPASSSVSDIRRTPLYSLHAELGAKFVTFAGYDMPVQYKAGIMAEHRHTRAAAGLFDVSHMGQVVLHEADPALALEGLVPGDLQTLKPGAMRYTMFTNENGGVLDDLMVLRRETDLFLVVNASRKADDLALLRASLGGVRIEYLEDRALLALQGPQAVAVASRLLPGIDRMGFMTGSNFIWNSQVIFVTRSGYTGEDGVELSIPHAQADAFARALLAFPEVAPIGLGARDSLRLEAGLCLYGNDLTPETTPIEAGLAWTISRRRRTAGGFPGDAVIQKQLAEGPPRRRVGIKPAGRAPAREHTRILAGGADVGEITSGGFGPSVDGPVAMGYVAAARAAIGTALDLEIRGRAHPATVVPLPFTPHRYARI